MKLLAIAQDLPATDRASGDLRLFQMLKILAREHRVTLAAYRAKDQRSELGEGDFRRYRAALQDAGVSVVEDRLLPVLKSERFDATLLEFHWASRHWIDRVRFDQPHTRIIIDSVDCHFLRLFRRAEVTGQREDFDRARLEKARELGAYARGDLILTVTNEDSAVLAAELPRSAFAVVPNIHSIPPLGRPASDLPDSIVFVGGFKHDPNIDAVRYFCREIFPLVRAQVPAARLLIAGSDPPPSVRQLAGEQVEVLGFVPDLASTLRAAIVSVAPLRYGAGLKGKVGEAMSFGLPVVTTSVGAEGFGLEHGTHALVADRAVDFATAVIRLLKTPELRQRIGSQARALIARKFSDTALRSTVLDTFDHAMKIRPAQLSIARRLQVASSLALERNVLWRLQEPRRV
jgi:glycosyltransferase involved in cell wall biosynthesis